MKLPIEIQNLLNKKNSVIANNFKSSVKTILKLIDDLKNDYPEEGLFSEVSETWIIDCILQWHNGENWFNLFYCHFPDGWEWKLPEQIREKVLSIETEFHNSCEAYYYLLQKQRKLKGECLECCETGTGENGMIRSSRGNLCYYYTPVRGLTKTEENDINVYNPRSKKHFNLKILNDSLKDECLYRCVDENGKIYYITSETNVCNAWDALFKINKDLYRGWWNKILIKE